MSREPLFIALSLGLTLATPASATQFTWDGDGSAPLNDDAGAWAATGGTNWLNGTTSVYGAWGNTTADEAIFGSNNGAAGTITVGTVTANKITFNAAGSGNYALSGGTITLGGTSPKITANVDATISSVIAGTTRWTRDGAGILSSSGTNTSTGGVTLSGGKAILGATATLMASAAASNNALNVNGGATLSFLSANPFSFGASASLGQLA
ncbi:MAG: hypothetical protein QM755_02680 [Luteolibacter sp.]